MAAPIVPVSYSLSVTQTRSERAIAYDDATRRAFAQAVNNVNNAICEFTNARLGDPTSIVSTVVVDMTAAGITVAATRALYAAKYIEQLTALGYTATFLDPNITVSL